MRLGCVNTMDINLTLSSLQDKGYRITKIRKEVIKIFSGYSIPLSTNKVIELLSDSGVTVNKATVYREIKFLLRKGYLTEVYLYPNEVSYESSELKHHHHLVCERCGRVDNVTNCLARELEDDVYKKKGFRISRHSLELYGTCADCIKKNTNEKR